MRFFSRSDEQRFVEQMLSATGSTQRPWVDGAIARSLLRDVGDWTRVEECIGSGDLKILRGGAKYRGAKVAHFGKECAERLSEMRKA